MHAGALGEGRGRGSPVGTLVRQQQQQRASTDRRNAAPAPTQLQPNHTAVTDMRQRSVPATHCRAAGELKRPAAEEATATITAHSHHGNVHLTEPPLGCGFIADLASAGAGQIASEAPPFR